MKKIVVMKNNEAMVSIRNIATFGGVEYESTQRLVRNNKKEFAELGLSIPKESDFISVMFDEYQASFLITLMKNTPVVKRFKLDLVKQFKNLNEQKCETNQKQVETSKLTIANLKEKVKEARGSYLKTDTDGATALRKYINSRKLQMSEEELWDFLEDEGYIGTFYEKTKKRILLDLSIGKQNGKDTPRFFHNQLDHILGVKEVPNLLDFLEGMK